MSKTAAEAEGRPKASFFRSVKMVAWSFLGIRKNSEYKDDLAQVSPVHVIIAGLLGVMLMVVGLIVLVKWVVAG
jgi:hypothetical protein